MAEDISSGRAEPEERLADIEGEAAGSDDGGGFILRRQAGVKALDAEISGMGNELFQQGPPHIARSGVLIETGRDIAHIGFGAAQMFAGLNKARRQRVIVGMRIYKCRGPTAIPGYRRSQSRPQRPMRLCKMAFQVQGNALPCQLLQQVAVP